MHLESRSKRLLLIDFASIGSQRDRPNQSTLFWW
jgi:hypothetical protein